jgi:putative endonuclease
MLRCKDKSIYTGVTSNLEERVIAHQSGKHPKSYTFTRRPLELVYFQKFTNPNLAIEFEKKLKKWSRLKKEALIQENYELLQAFSECRNATHHKYKPSE